MYNIIHNIHLKQCYVLICMCFGMLQKIEQKLFFCNANKPISVYMYFSSYSLFAPDLPSLLLSSLLGKKSVVEKASALKQSPATAVVDGELVVATVVVAMVVVDVTASGVVVTTGDILAVVGMAASVVSGTVVAAVVSTGAVTPVVSCAMAVHINMYTITSNNNK